MGYPPLAVVTIAYPKSSFLQTSLPNKLGSLQNLPGMGNLIPRSEGIRTLGTLWLSSMFPNRCPQNYQLLVSFLGGSTDTSIEKITEQEIHQQVHKDCQGILVKETSQLPKLLSLKIWKNSIPQYELGHDQMIREVEARLRYEEVLLNNGRTWLCGNYIHGVSLGDCIDNGIR